MTKNQIKKLENDYPNAEFRYDIPYTIFQLKTVDAVITAYTSGKVVFAGKNPEKHARKYGIVESSVKAQEHTVSFPMAGSDEVGTGDFFGPVTVCACYVSKEDLNKIPVDEIVDSKQITDDKIRSIAPILIDNLSHSLLILNNHKYNQVHQTHNMNAIKALLHNQAFINLSKKVTLPKGNVIIDQFMKEPSYYRVLQHEEAVYRNLVFETKAENKFLAVACAAIIARYAFIEQLDLLERHYGMPLPKGAGTKVDLAGVEFVKKHGLDKLDHVAKTHFKNREKIIELL
ncbi:ribonuclease HIII [Erysipelothrix urinaevulpis]|uniref:ribonuclease HIII n=1 Tax=Erysipelothrix urinaevulpis TaxID=2683717 RepID=UPI001F02F090|nr:ribonuclease HIII [Erysipelothrix urinaevulpis]